MKKIAISFIFMVVCMIGHAQFTKGTFLIGGSFSGTFDTNKTKSGTTTTTTGKTSTVQLMPQGGYFVMDNLAVGAGIDLSTQTDKPQTGGNKTVISSTSIAPFARYYFQKFYGQASFEVGSAKNKTVNGSVTNETKFTATGWNLAVGYAYFLNDHIAVEPQLGYGSNSLKSGNVTGIKAGPFIKIGLQVYLRK